MKNLLKKVRKAFNKSSYILLYFLDKQFINRFISDKTFLKMKYRLIMGEKLDLKEPQTYNAKLQWLKLYNRSDDMTMMADKYAVRKYVADTIGEEYLIPLIGVWDSVEDIDFESLPNQFAMKCNHTSGNGVVICKDKTKLDIEKTKKEMKKAMKKDYSSQNREWPYKNIKRKIVVEKYMVDESGTQLKDYKFFCFNGEVKAMFLLADRGIDTSLNFYDENFNKLPFERGYKNISRPMAKPVGFEKMKELAGILSKDLTHARIDFYDINGKIYFGEITFYPGSGYEKFKPKEWDYTFGSWINLPQKNI